MKDYEGEAQGGPPRFDPDLAEVDRDLAEYPFRDYIPIEEVFRFLGFSV